MHESGDIIPQMVNYCNDKPSIVHVNTKLHELVA